MFGGGQKGDAAFSNFSEQVLALSYKQTIVLMAKMLESLKYKRSEADFSELKQDVARNSMNAMWEELKNDTW